MPKTDALSRILLAVVCLCFVLGALGFTLTASERDQDLPLGASVSSEQELIDALNSDVARHITLNRPVTLTQSYQIGFSMASKTLDTGGNGITLAPGVKLTITGNLTIQGEGAEHPLLTLKAHTNALSFSNLTVNTFGTAIYGEEDVTIKASSIRMIHNAAQILSDDNIHVFLSSVNGGTLAAANQVNLYGSNVAALGTFAYPVMRLSPLNLREKYTFQTNEAATLPEKLNFRCSWEGTDVQYEIEYDVQWNTIPNTVGEHLVTGFPKIDGTPADKIVCPDLYTQAIISEPGKLVIGSAAMINNKLELHTLMPEQYAGTIQLLMSLDQGATWVESNLDGQNQVSGPSFKVILTDLDVNWPYHFCLRLTLPDRTLESNVMVVTVHPNGQLATETYATRASHPAPLFPPSVSANTVSDSRSDSRYSGRTTQDKDIITITDDSGDKADKTSKTDEVSKTEEVVKTEEAAKIEIDDKVEDFLPPSVPIEIIDDIPDEKVPLLPTPPVREGGAQGNGAGGVGASVADAEPSDAQSPETLASQAGELAYTPQQLEDIITANPLQVTFVNDSLRLSIPTKSLQTIDLEEDEQLGIQLTQDAVNQYSVRMFAGEREIIDFGGEAFEVTLSAPEQWEKISKMTCMGDDGIAVPMLLNEETGDILITLRSTGSYQVTLERNGRSEGESGDDHAALPTSYQIVQESDTPAKTPATTPDNAFAGATAIAAAMGFVLSLIWRWRKRA